MRPIAAAVGISIVIIGVAVVSLRFSPDSGRARTTALGSASLAGKVDELFAEWSTSTSPGCSLGVGRGSTIAYEGSSGTANVELGVAITPASVFHAASIAKQFTAMSILLLAQRGQLSLDDEARKYIVGSTSTSSWCTRGWRGTGRGCSRGCRSTST